MRHFLLERLLETNGELNVLKGAIGTDSTYHKLRQRDAQDPDDIADEAQ